MGLLKNLVNKFGEDKKVVKAKLKEAEQDLRIQKILAERQKSSNRREFERYMQEQEEERITQALSKIRKQKNKEVWKSNHSVLKSDTNILNNDRPILKEKNIFRHGKNSFLTKTKFM